MLNMRYFVFLTGEIPVICNKIKRPSIRHLNEMFFNMEGTRQVYYSEGLPVPLSKRNMEVSLFITKLMGLVVGHLGESKIDGLVITDKSVCYKRSNPKEIWIFYGEGSQCPK